MENTKASDTVLGAEVGWTPTIKLIWYFLKGQRVQFVSWSVVLMIMFLHSLIPPIIVAKMLDALAIRKADEPLYPIYGYALLLGVIWWVVSVIRLTAKTRLVEMRILLRYTAKTESFKRLVGLPLNWHDGEGTGNKVQRIITSNTSLEKLMRVFTGDLFQVFSIVSGTIAVFMYKQPLLALLCIFHLLVFHCIQFYYQPRVKALIDEQNATTEKASGTFYEGLNNILAILASGSQNTFSKRIEEREGFARNKAFDSAHLGIKKWRAFQFVNAVFLTVFMGICIHSVAFGTIALTSVLVFFAYVLSWAKAIGDSTETIDEIIEAKLSFARIVPLFDRALDTTQGTLVFPKDWQAITASNLYFDYGTAKQDGDQEKPETLSNINLTIGRSTKIGIVGASGSGKSTFAKVIAGLYSVNAGSVSIDGLNVQKIQPNSLVQTISLIPQSTELFNGPLHENITMLNEVNPELFEKALRIAQLNEVIAELPQGIETKVGEKGYRLSGGQRQRVGIARAICANPQVLILDESTSSLDTRAEQRIYDAIQAELIDTTIIIIAHRISTLKHVDEIVVFEKGRIKEQGTYKELHTNTSSHFNQVYRVQRSSNDLVN